MGRTGEEQKDKERTGNLLAVAEVQLLHVRWKLQLRHVAWYEGRKNDEA